MLRKKTTILFFIVFIFFPLFWRGGGGEAIAQSGEIQGKIKDKTTGEGIPFANVVVEMSGYQKGGATTDFDGNYSIKPLSPGNYDVKVSYVGYQPALQKGVVVSADKATFVHFEINAGIKLNEVEVTDYKIPLIDPGQTSTGNTVTREQIANLPTRNIQSIAATSSGVVQADEGQNIFIKGSRSNSNLYIIDGVRVRGANALVSGFALSSGTTAIPSSGIEQVTVITGGIPAKYGDVTGGVVEITTRGASKNFSSSGEFVTSKFLDPFNYNLGSASLSGPILIKNKGTEMERGLLGFFIAGEYEWIKDATPPAIGTYKVKDDRHQELINEPLRLDDNDIIRRSAEYITKDDLELVKTRPNAASSSARFSGKIDYTFSKNINFTFGGSYNYGKQRLPVYDYTMFDWENHPVYESNNWRMYGRITHKLFGTKNKKGEESKKSAFAIQNGFYTLQVDYSKDKDKLYHEDHKENFFNYGYIGKFQTYRKNNWQQYEIAPGDTVWGNTLPEDTLVTFSPGGVNPYLDKITSAYYDLLSKPPTSKPPTNLDEIESGPGMINGTRVGINNQSAYAMFAMPGRLYNGYTKNDNDQFSATFDVSFDIKRNTGIEKNKHSIEFGLVFETSANRHYGLSPIQLWTLMRQEVNSHLSNLGTSNPIWLTDTTGGHNQEDTVWFARQYSDTAQRYFDKKLREKLGLAVNGTDYIDIDNLSPETFSLDMFTANELVDYNDVSLSYRGYDYTGKKLKKNPKFDDYFTAKDADGNYTRPQGAYRPIYSAVYVQDKFYFRDLNFNIGLRIDRFTSNQKVLKDPYSLYPIKTVAEVDGFNVGGVFQEASHPSVIGDDYLVYVDNVENPTSVKGYRKEDKWYAADGTALPDGDQLVVGGKIQPYLVDPKMNIKSPDYDPSVTFENYKPVYSYMPRIAFSFPISDVAQFFTYYDVLTQRPNAGATYSSPESYYLLENNKGLNNSALKPQRTIDYQIGYKQKVSRTSVITFSGFYREMKDMIQWENISNAYPTSYTTYGNKDFGTVKGIAISYDLRKTQNVTMTANYTLQFAEGTGSNANTQANLISLGRTELRTILPLDYDQRHVIVLSFDYRYGEGSNYNGPKWFKTDFLANAGANVMMRVASGFPYSKYSVPGKITGNRATSLSGSPNSARLPWTFNMDLKLDKNFKIKLSKKDAVKQRRPLYCNVYLLVQNVLNTKNVLYVHPFTGSPDDDGYLSSPTGQEEVVNTTPDARSFTDLYAIYASNNPPSDEIISHYTLPRRTRLGLIINF